MTVYTVSPFWRDARPSTGLIDPVAFALALVLGPALATLVLAWAIVPVFALLMGWPAFVIIGTPILLWWLQHHEVRVRDIALLSFLANAALAGILAAYDQANGHTSAVNYALFGLFFGPLWGAGFADIYRRLRRELYAPRRRESTLTDLKEGDI